MPEEQYSVFWWKSGTTIYETSTKTALKTITANSIRETVKGSHWTCTITFLIWTWKLICMNSSGFCSFYCQVPTLHGLLYHWLTTLWRIEHNLSCRLGSPKDLKERFSVSWIWRYLEGNGNPLQYSCLENPKDGGAWWAAVYGTTQSRTRLKWLSLA